MRDAKSNSQKERITTPEEIAAAYYDDIYRYAYRRVGNQFDAQDITQEVFLKFVSHIQTYHERGQLRSYLFKLALNAANDLFRKKRGDLALDKMPDIPDEALTPAGKVEKEEMQMLVQNALHSLPSFQQDVIILRVYHEMPFKEIARITGSSVSTVKSRYWQGLEKMKKMLEVT